MPLLIGTAFAFLGFFQTVTMTAVPMISGYIIEEDSHNYMRGYRDSSFLFVVLCIVASGVSLAIMLMATPQSFRYVDEKELVCEQTMENKKADTSGEICSA
jgi:surface polysaccharide O-acyltransferase-like enzyme